MDNDKLIEFAKEQCEIFPEDSAMGRYLRETLKMLQVDPAEDAISKASVFEIVGNLMSIPYDLDRRITEKDVSESMDEIRSLPPVKPTQRWIPVSERLPSIKNQTNKYLVTLKDKTVCDAMFTEHNGEHWWTYDDVVAWMPLPPSYQGEENG